MIRRRDILASPLGLGLARSAWGAANTNRKTREAFALAGLRGPTSIYINWSAYDELSDNIELTEKLAMTELDALLDLRRAGAQFDVYLMDCFWFDEKGSYRTFRKPSFPRGGMPWIQRCMKNQLAPGLWIGTNAAWGKNPKAVLDAWKSSYDPTVSALSLANGGFLDDLMQALQDWVDRGVSCFKFDFANFDAAPDGVREVMTREEIRTMNAFAFAAALGKFRARNPQVITLAYNGFGGSYDSTHTRLTQDWDGRWLRVFDALYSGDPRFSDVPMANHWRSLDLYSDHTVRRFESNGIPLERIDSSSFMMGNTGTCYYRGKKAFRGALLLALARGGLANTYYGNMENFNADDRSFFARAQKLFYPLQALGRTLSFGPAPGEAKAPYGWANLVRGASVFTVVNPTQAEASIVLPGLSTFAVARSQGRVLFRDAGKAPVLDGDRLTLGAEGMAVVAFGDLANEANDLGYEPDVVVPSQIRPIATRTQTQGPGKATATIDAPSGTDLRLFALFRNAKGRPVQVNGGPPPAGKPMNEVARMQAVAGTTVVPVAVPFDRAIYSGLSWTTGTVSGQRPAGPLTVSLVVPPEGVSNIEVQAFAVSP